MVWDPVRLPILEGLVLRQPGIEDPALAGGRVLGIPPDVMRPGPYLDRALRLIARAIHGPGVLPAPEAVER